MSEPHVLDSLPAYVLGGLEEDELTQVERHLRECPACRQELHAYHRTAASLAEAVPAVQPPERLRAAILDRISPEPPAARRSRPGWFAGIRSAPAWALAAVLLVIGLAAGNLLLWQQLRAAVPSEFRTIALYSTDAAPQASGMLVTDQNGTSGTLIVSHLPELPETQQYQLWLVEGDQRESGGVFSVDEEGYGSMWVWADQPLGDYPAFGITIEPAGGSPGPTGPRVLGSEL